MTPREVWCNEAQERYVLAIAPADLDAVSRASANASVARSQWSARANAERRNWSSMIAHFGNAPVDMPLDVLLGKPPKMTRDVARGLRVRCLRSIWRASTLEDAALRVLQLPAVADKTFLDHDRRSHGRRPVLARPDGRAVASAGRRCRRHAR